MSVPTVHEAIRAHLTSEQRPLDYGKLIEELMRLAKSAPDAYPKADAAQWEAALKELARDGVVSWEGRRVAIIRQVVAGKRGRKVRSVAEDSGLLF